MATMAPNPWPAMTTRPAGVQQLGTLGDCHDVGRQRIEGVGVGLGRGVGQPVAAAGPWPRTGSRHGSGGPTGVQVQAVADRPWMAMTDGAGASAGPPQSR